MAPATRVVRVVKKPRGRPPSGSRPSNSTSTTAGGRKKKISLPTKDAQGKGKARAKPSTAMEDELATAPTIPEQRNPSRPSQIHKARDLQRMPITPSQREQTVKRLRKDFPRLKPRTRHVPQTLIKSKWPPLTQQAQEQVKEIFKAAKRPVVESRKDDKQRVEAELVLNRVVQRLEARLPNMPFPAKTREVHFDLEKLMEHNRTLGNQLTTSLHAVELLEAEIAREERALQRERDALEELEANARDAEQRNERNSTKVHPLLRNSTLSEDDSPEAINLANSSSTQATFPDETDADLAPILDQLRNHLESMQANVAPVQVLGSTISKAHGALSSTLLKNMTEKEYAQMDE